MKDADEYLGMSPEEQIEQYGTAQVHGSSLEGLRNEFMDSTGLEYQTPECTPTIEYADWLEQRVIDLEGILEIG